MRAHLKSRGAGIWEITQDETYAIPLVHTSQDDKDKYYANNKAVDILLASLCRSEFDRVEDLVLAHKIWFTLQSFHEGTNQVKSRLFETYRREYETFSHLPGETTNALFQRFLATVNKMKANIAVLPYTDHDQALKLLHSLNRDVWGTKVDAIIESAGYETLSTNELFSKLKSTEVDMKLRSKHADPTDPHSLVLMSGYEQSSSANKSNMSFALSALLSVSEEQLEVLEDEELAMITRRFMRFNDNCKNRQRSNNTYFECGKPGHFIADCPDKNKSKGGYDYNKDKDKDKDKKKKKRYYDREKKEKRKKAKARVFIAFLSDVDSDTEDHEDSSSSDEDDDRKAKKKDGRNMNGLCFYTNKKRGGNCVMAHDAIEHKEDDSESEAEDDGLENMCLMVLGLLLDQD